MRGRFCVKTSELPRFRVDRFGRRETEQAIDEMRGGGVDFAVRSGAIIEQNAPINPKCDHGDDTESYENPLSNVLLPCFVLSLFFARLSLRLLF